MNFDYPRLIASASRVLTKFGRDVTRTTYTGGTYDKGTGTITPATASTTRKGVLFDYDDKEEHGQSFVRGLRVINGDKQLLLDAQGAAALSDHYTVGGIEYTVVSVSDVSPAGFVVLYDLHLRQA